MILEVARFLLQNS